jgi:hypothetical protein
MIVRKSRSEDAARKVAADMMDVVGRDFRL